jgi:hypothetical protein
MAVSQTLKLYQMAQDAADNTSELRIIWKSTQSGDSRNNDTRTANYWVSVNGGTEQKYSVNYTLPKGKTQTILDVTITVPHDDLGKCSVAVRTWMDTKISAGVVQKSASIDLTPIPRANTITAGDAYIGGDMRISVVRKSASYLHTIEYAFGSLCGTIAEKSAASEYDFRIPDDWDMEMTKSKTAPITLTCITYAGDTEIGRSTAKAQIKTDGTFAPQLSWNVVDINPATIALTGNAKRLIAGASTARATLDAIALRGATLLWLKINSVMTRALEIPNVQSGAFTFAVKDSRGWETTEAASLSVVPYIPVTAIIEAERGAQGSNALTVTVEGYYYNGSFGEEINTLSVQYKADSGAWQTATPTISGNTYTATINLSLDYQTAHGLYFRIADKLTTLTPSQNIPRAVPQTMEGEGWIRHNVPVIQRSNHDNYVGRGDADESGLENWLNGLMAGMPDMSSRRVVFVCSAVTGYTVCAELFRYTADYASVLGHSYDGNIYHKTLYNGVWNATKKGAIT